MTPRHDPESIVHALEIAERCDDACVNVHEGSSGTEKKMAQVLRVAARIIRGQHHALRDAMKSGPCLHTLVTRITEQMNADGMDARSPGKYCMTCGALLEEAPRKAG